MVLFASLRYEKWNPAVVDEREHAKEAGSEHESEVDEYEWGGE